jgi:deoxyribodipyrimidine photo-lyase
VSTAIVWFRRDLRLHDHPALATAVREHDCVVPLFVCDDRLLSGRAASDNRAAFMHSCLDALDTQLRSLGSRLVTRAGRPEEVLVELARETGARAVFWTSDVSPYARARDRRVTHALRAAGVTPRPHGGTYVIDVSKPRTKGGSPYHVFTPFFRSWQIEPRRPVEAAPRALAPLPTELDAGTRPQALLTLGEQNARRAARSWFAGPIRGYGSEGSSRLSPYLRWGCLSARALEAEAQRTGGAGAEAWIRQLAWRDFYAHVLLHWPQNLEHEFQERHRELEWSDDDEHLDAWRHGQTGYPIVDAAMRELATSGWMHNRARLIVGSFLTKDLHLDWRHGERWFSKLLLDGEPAQNNGNWQWIASVGVDPAPAFRRIYNPTLQGRRFDPDGSYIRRHVPELARVPDDRLFEPWTMTVAEQRAAGCAIGTDYPAPIIDHRVERQRALERYRVSTAA